MRIFVCGNELGLGFLIARQLISHGNKVDYLTQSEAFLPNLRKHGMNPLLGKIGDPVIQRHLSRADAVIDAEFPLAPFRKRMYLDRLRPVVLKRALHGHRIPLLVTSHAAVLGDTGPVPLTESARMKPLRGFAWAARFEKEVLRSRGVQGMVIRPAWHVYGPGRLPFLLAEKLTTLAWRYKRGKYIGNGDNQCSAVNLNDLADLYCRAIEHAKPGMLLHGASENFSTMELAAAVHRGMKLKGQPSTVTLQEVEKIIPNAAILTRSHAISGNLARAIMGWEPSAQSALEEVERTAGIHAWAKRNRIPKTQCRER